MNEKHAFAFTATFTIVNYVDDIHKFIHVELNECCVKEKKTFVNKEQF